MKMKTKHTPGPWIDITNTLRKNARHFRIVAPSRDDCCLFIDGESRTVSQAQANAHLVAAAPDLLSSVQYFEYAFNWADNEEPDDDEIIEIRVTGRALKDARAAIAKAEGA
jgi:hypothetical protein